MIRLGEMGAGLRALRRRQERGSAKIRQQIRRIRVSVMLEEEEEENEQEEGEGEGEEAVKEEG